VIFGQWLKIQRNPSQMATISAANIRAIARGMGGPRSGSAVPFVAVTLGTLAGVGFITLVLIPGLALAFALPAGHEIAPVIVENPAFRAAIEAMLHLLHVHSP
jgi:hypothetical protein